MVPQLTTHIIYWFLKLASFQKAILPILQEKKESETIGHFLADKCNIVFVEQVGSRLMEY